MKSISTISSHEALKLLKQHQAILIDIRDPADFAIEHIPYAYSLPLNSLKEKIEQLIFPTEIPIIVQCEQENNSQIASEVIQEHLGTYQLLKLEGGIKAWKEAQYPLLTQKKYNFPFSLFRQVQMIIGIIVLIGIFLGFNGFRWAYAVVGLIGAAVAFSGLFGWCGLSKLLLKMPWNK